ncbi:MAG: glycoside hydrolase family 15 protein [Chloroflexia bacterium]
MTASYPPIEDYGVIGDCHTAALVSSVGSVDWLCLPSFDSPSVFARILDLERGGEWQVRPKGRFRSRHSYLDDTNVLVTTFTTDGGRARLYDFMPMDAEDTAQAGQARRVVRVLEAVDGEIELECVCRPRPDYARSRPDLRIKGKRVRFGDFTLDGPAEWETGADDSSVTCDVTLREGRRVAFMLTCGPTDAGGLDTEAALQRTGKYWRAWAGRCTYDGPYREAVVRSALALKLLIHAPTGAIVAAPTTSLPEELGGERNWDYRFTWIRDASFTLHALLLAGYTDEDDAFFRWIVRTVELEQTGIKIMHPVTPGTDLTERTLDHLEGYRGSRPVRIGNAASGQVQLDVYGEVLNALYYAWKVGRYDPASVWERFRPIIDWVAANWRRQGSGVWEVRGGLRHFVFGKVMCWVALDRGIKLARSCGLEGDVSRWETERDRIREEVLEKGWSEKLGAFKQSYEDERLDAANLMMPIVGFPGRQPLVCSRRWMRRSIAWSWTASAIGISTHRRGSRSEPTFVLCTFWLIDALILAGRQDEAIRMFDGILARATPLGLFAEEIEHSTGAHLGNFPQAFSHIGVISAAVSLAQTGERGAIAPEHSREATAAGIGGGGQHPRKSSERESEGADG